MVSLAIKTPIHRNYPLITMLSSLSKFGYTLSESALISLSKVDEKTLINFWTDLKPSLSAITGDDRNMGDFVVYKNFPEEVLNKSESEYWFSQICMYIGLPSTIFTEEVKERAPLFEANTLKVLHLSQDNTMLSIAKELTQSVSSWTDVQFEHISTLITESLSTNEETAFNLTDFYFKDNGIKLFTFLINNNYQVNLNILDATDVLRLAACLTNDEESLSNRSKFKNFNRKTRQLLLAMLENSKNLSEDVAMRKSLFKKFFRSLKVGDYKNKFPKVLQVQDELYNNKLKSFSGTLEMLFNIINVNKIKISDHVIVTKINKPQPELPLSDEINNPFIEALNDFIAPEVEIIPEDITMVYNIEKSIKEIINLLVSRPGTFVKHFHRAYALFPEQAVSAFLSVVDKINTLKLLQIKKYICTVNNRNQFIYPPRGNWAMAKVAANIKPMIDIQSVDKLVKAITDTVAHRVSQIVPEGVILDKKLQDITLQTNGQDMAKYGRGSIIDIPDNVKFVRSASYWKVEGANYNNYFDNSWNFFDTEWKSQGVCCWNNPSFPRIGSGIDCGAIFSGDPTNRNELKGRACQMIDINFDKLLAHGVRFAVWNILSYSKINFDDADDVLATLQWGEDANKGKLYEPSRAQVVHKVQGKSLTKYLVFLDLQERKMVYLDANFKGSVGSAESNSTSIEKYMPAYIEYINSLPTIYDLFEGNQGGTVPVMYSDIDSDISGKSLVINPENPDNDLNLLSVEEFLV
jgi:hypothetical protein